MASSTTPGPRPWPAASTRPPSSTSCCEDSSTSATSPYGRPSLAVWPMCADCSTVMRPNASANWSSPPPMGPRPTSGSILPRGGEDDRTSELRATLITLRGAVADHSSTVEACRQRLDHPDPTLASAALSVVAAHGDTGGTSPGSGGASRRRRTPQTEQRHLAALADFPDAELVRTILEGTLDGSVRTQDGPYLVRRALLNRLGGSEAWDFLSGHWDRLLGIFPTNYSLARMLEGVTALDQGRAGPPGARLPGRAPPAPVSQAGRPAPGAPRHQRRVARARVRPPGRRHKPMKR